MARIRTIKPDCLQHRKVGRLSDRCVRVWLGMLTQADDEGRLPCDPGQVLSWCGYSYHPTVKMCHVEKAILQVADMRLIRLYSVNGTRYAVFPSFRDHQVINRPTPSTIPPPPESDSVNDHGWISEDSVRTPEGRKGRKEGKEGRNSEAKEVLRWLNVKAGRSYQPGKVNLGFILARLDEGALPEQLKAVVSRKVREWQGTDMEKFLRPATLFNAVKCSQYLGELPALPEQAAGAKPVDPEGSELDAAQDSEVTRAREGEENAVPE